MFVIDQILFIAALLLFFGVASSKFSTRFGVPVLVAFLVVGMVAGSEGLGGIAFEDYRLAHGVATLSLALILFDGGLRTRFASFRLAWKPALSLATLGVAITAGVTGVAAAYLLNLPLREGLLLGSIVGSTDAAAVFAVLRSQGLQLQDRLASTLEVESGSNDPMALLLTVGIIEFMLGRLEGPVDLIKFFFVQMGVGALVGYVSARAAVFTVNRVNLSAAGLYPLLITAFGLFAYGAAALAGGSGLLAVYLAGLIIGNSKTVFKNGILFFHDGVAWLAQIAMFVMLGLLSFPSRLVGASYAGLVVAGVLILLARPIAIAVSLIPFRFSLREMLFINWGGLKGAVPIVLATYPLMLGIPDSRIFFDVVFFVVLVSTIAQGWSLAWLARKLGLEAPGTPPAPVALEITSLRDVDGDIVEYVVDEQSRAAHRKVRELALPETAVVAMIARQSSVIPPRGSTVIQPGDHVFVVLRADVRTLVDRSFAPAGEHLEGVSTDLEFPLQGSVTVRQLREFYDIALAAPDDMTLDDLLRERIGALALKPGAHLTLDHIVLFVRQLGESGAVEQVGLCVLGD